MKPSRVYRQYSAHIRGRNFYGSAQINETKFTMELTQFRKRDVFQFSIDHPNFSRQFKRFPIFTQFRDLFDELIQNQNLSISDLNTLIVPLTAKYEKIKLDLKIELILVHKIFDCERQKTKKLFEIIQKMNDEHQKIQNHLKILPQLIKFKGDQENLNYSQFKVSQDCKIIQKTGKNQIVCFNHTTPLKKKGIFFFKVKIIKTKKKSISLGICTKEIKDKTNKELYFSPFFVGLYLVNGNFFSKGNDKVGAVGLEIVYNKNID